MSLIAGTRIGSYEIGALIGEGGMGRVYRATDTTLRREVAIKVLSPAFATDPDRVSRFDREARLLAAINHPNIAAIYGIENVSGQRALVLELVEGDTLAERLRGGRLPLADAFDVARQIAAALEAAHDRGIVHRDLKPANVKISREGVVKVLDFGLAKTAGIGAGLDGTDSVTATVEPTREGVILGTVSYMSPEQARGRAVDKRTDIWAFGCVLYEILSGRRPFVGDTTVDTLAAIVEREPDWSQLPDDVPEPVRRLLNRCLEKDSRQRLRDIGEARIELTHAGTPAERDNAPGRRRSRVRRSMWVGAATAVLLVAAGALLLRQAASSPAEPEPPVQLTDFADSVVMPSLSRDGRMLTFVRGADFGRTAPPRGRVYVKLLPDGEPVELSSGGAGYPTFDPDTARIVYTKVTGGSWDSWEVPVLGGAPQLFLTNASGLTWLNERWMVYSELKSGNHMGIVASSPSRSERREIYFPEVGGMAHRTVPSPDSRSLLVVEMHDGVWQPCRLLPADGSTPGAAVGPPGAQCTSAAWSPDGRRMYFSSNAGGAFHIWQQRYPDGAPEQLTFGPTQEEGTAISPDGRSLITSMGMERAAVWLHDRSGERPLVEEGYVTWPSMDPSGTRLYYLMRTEASQGQATGELWTMALATGRRQRLFPELVVSQYALSQDGRRVVFTTAKHQAGDGIWTADLDQRTAPRQLTRTGEKRAFFGPPGEIVFMGDDNRLRRVRDDGSAAEVVSPDPIVYLITVSPDGRWAVVIAPSSGQRGGTRLEFRSLRGEAPVIVCEEECRGMGPANVRYNMPFHWSADGTQLVVNLAFLGGDARAAVLPYRSDAPFATLWPAGLGTAHAVLANPGARALAASSIFPAAAPAGYMTWRPSFHSNLYRIRLPQ